MSYGTPEWQKWVLGEEEGIAQIKFAYVSLPHFNKKAPDAHLARTASINPGPFFSYENGIQTFDTANVSLCGQTFASCSGSL
jgi:hypothetical protein